MTTHLLLGGGTGLVGGLLTERLLARPDMALTSLVRQRPPLPGGEGRQGEALTGEGRKPEQASPSDPPRARATRESSSPCPGGEVFCDFEALVADPAAEVARLNLPPCEVGISCLGTTIAKAKSQAAFRRVDHDYVLALAKAAKALGARRFILVSSVGAKAGSGNFYLSVKGGIEAAVAALGFDRLDILRPGLILGPRADRRPAEEWAQRAAAWLNPVVKAIAPDYAAVRAEDVAAKICDLTQPSAIPDIFGIPGTGHLPFVADQ